MGLEITWFVIGAFVAGIIAECKANKRYNKYATAFDQVEYDLRKNGHEDAAKLAVNTYRTWMRVK